MVEESTIQDWDSLQKLRNNTRSKKSVATFQVMFMFFRTARWSLSDIENVLSPSWSSRISEVLSLTLPRLPAAVLWLLTAFPPLCIILAQMCLPSGQGVRFIYSFRFMPAEWMQGLDYGFAYTRNGGCEFTSYSVNLYHSGCSLHVYFYMQLRKPLRTKELLVCTLNVHRWF